MAYVDALFDRKKDRIFVVERNNGVREYKEYPANYVFYYDDPKGKHRTIYDTPVSRFSTKLNKEFQKEVRIHDTKHLWESDINPVFRCLSENYLGIPSPKLQTCFFDIETDFDPLRGFAPTSDPFNPITAISVYLDWLDKLVTLVLPPKGYSWDTAQEICNKFENCILFEKEEELLDTFINLIDDADILSGWNSEGYDIPYTVGRIIRVLSKNDTRRLCLWDQLPKTRDFERFGATNTTFDLIGRVHLDYMQLYRKYTYEERHSYSLDAIGEYELDERKVAYEGTLDQLYNKDFPKFIEYNRQDTVLLAKLDKKLKFLDLANELAHDNTVLLQTTMGAVAVTEQAIINQAHEMGMVVPNRKEHHDTQAAGAYVAYPKKGMHKDIGAVDLNSLYPSTIRALNMGPESIVGQLRLDITDHYIAEQMQKNGGKFAEAWEGLFATFEYTAVMEMQAGTEITIDWEASGTSTVHSASEIWSIIFDSNKPWMLSANGTIFSFEKEAIVPSVLKRWYAERQVMQANKKAATTPDEIAYWDKKQQVKKINLNSLYGALLNAGCRFFDKRVGQSTTLTGRAIAKHMDAFINECIMGEYDHTGEAIVYGDSVTGDTIIATSIGEMNIADLYNLCPDNYTIGEKEYGSNHGIQVVGYDATTKIPVMAGIHYVMRHHTNKQLFKVTFDNGNVVTVTEDHSLMAERDGVLYESAPTDLRDGDLFVCLNRRDDIMTTTRTTVASIECLGEITDYVYDISISDQEHVFFANNCLVHNTDSCASDTVIRTNWGDLPIESLFHSGTQFWNETTEYGIKEYSTHSDMEVASYDTDSGEAYYDNINYIYRHKVSKERWQIEDENGNTVIVTGDHSVMVERDEKLLEIKPRDMVETDVLISI